MNTKLTAYETLLQIAKLCFTKTFPLMQEIGLHPGQMQILSALARREGTSQSELAARLFVSAPTIATSISRLESAELVARQKAPGDRRKALIYLTQKGRAAAQCIDKVMLEINEEVLCPLTPCEATQLESLLTKIFQTLAQKAENGADCHSHKNSMIKERNQQCFE